jgi:hypothetical protein
VRTKFTLAFLILAFLVSCSSSGSPTTTPDTPTPAPELTASPTSAIPLVILVLPADMNQQEADQYQSLVYNLAQADGMRFQVRNTLTPEDVAFEGPALKVVIAVPPDPGLATLAAAAPGMQFLAVGIPGLAPAANLSIIGANGIPLDQQAFLAGYIAGLVAPEWKVGVLYQKDTAEGEAARDAFSNGFTFYCGTCRSEYFSQPTGIYPVLVGIPADAQESDYSAYANILVRNVVNVVYVYPEIATPDLLDYITQNTDMLAISQTLPDDQARPQWIASIQPDLISTLQNIFPDLVAGNGGQSIPTPLFLSDVNPDLLTEGRLRLAQDVLDGLQNGTISTGVSP